MMNTKNESVDDVPEIPEPVLAENRRAAENAKRYEELLTTWKSAMDALLIKYEIHPNQPGSKMVSRGTEHPLVEASVPSPVSCKMTEYEARLRRKVDELFAERERLSRIERHALMVRG